MASAPTEAQALPLFPYHRWRAQLADLAHSYQAAYPFPYIHFSEFLDADAARAAAEEFPETTSRAWIQYKHVNENKAGLTTRKCFPSLLGRIVDELNSPAFLEWMSQLTGIPSLIADPTLEGGGLHQASRGGFLNLHTDFTTHRHNRNWRRRLNLILYLNPEWQEKWGGAIELWDAKQKRCAISVPPFLNHALVFSTTDLSFHGFPERLACPEGVSRKSLALYYYTLDEQHSVVRRSTNYLPRPEDSRFKASLIWLDKKAVHVYSRMKETLGISDSFASRVLEFLSRKK